MNEKALLEQFGYYFRDHEIRKLCGKLKNSIHEQSEKSFRADWRWIKANLERFSDQGKVQKFFGIALTNTTGPEKTLLAKMQIVKRAIEEIDSILETKEFAGKQECLRAGLERILHETGSDLGDVLTHVEVRERSNLEAPALLNNVETCLEKAKQILNCLVDVRADALQEVWDADKFDSLIQAIPHYWELRNLIHEGLVGLYLSDDGYRSLVARITTLFNMILDELFRAVEREDHQKVRESLAALSLLLGQVSAIRVSELLDQLIAIVRRYQDEYRSA